MDSIEIVDFGRLASDEFQYDVDDGDEEWARVGKDLRKSFEKIGFAYIKNHGISQELIDKSHGVAEEFFNLPEEVKVKYSQVVGYKQGYVEMNREIINEEHGKEYREGFDIIDKNGTLPTEVEDFADTVKNLIDSSIKTSMKILKCLEIALDLQKGTLLNKHKKIFKNTDENFSQFRMLHYPPIPATAKAGDTRLGTHSDYGTFTFLFQDSMKGLEALNRQDKWVLATPIRGTILVNVGDYLEMLTEGRMVATKHRVRIPEEEAVRRCSRRSLVFFVGPENDTIFAPLSGPPPERKLTYFEYIQEKFHKAYQY